MASDLYDNVDDDQDDTDNSDQDQDTSDQDQDQDQSSDDSSSDDSSDQSQQAADEHRNALGSLVDNLKSKGIDVDSMAQEIGLNSSDVNNLEDDDVMALSKYVAQNHPEVTQQVYSRFPIAQSLLGRFFG